MIDLIKVHAYGNDFLFTSAEPIAVDRRAAWARRVCDRHQGVGADGLIFYAPTSNGASMQLVNADGSDSEVSGNGVRCLAALAVSGMLDPNGAASAATAGTRIVIQTDAGPKRVTCLGQEEGRLTFETVMGHPEEVEPIALTAAGEALEAVRLRVGNPQCVVLMPLPARERFLALGAALSQHEAFPAGTNVELAEVVSLDRIRILIWERGVGPTMASGTGACAAAVAAAAYGGAGRDVEVEAPGGTQRVRWDDRGLQLTGWAEIVWSGRWRGEAPGA